MGRRPLGEATGTDHLSYHPFGLAIDVNKFENIYIAHSEEEGKIIQRATELIGGVLIDIRQPGGLSVAELHARFVEVSRQVREYVALRNNRDELGRVLTSRRGGMPTDTEIDDERRIIEHDYRELRRRNARWNPETEDFIDLSLDLVQALCNAGLMWGGQYAGGADLQHFDWRGGTIRPEHRI
jgi:hypothetical protein